MDRTDAITCFDAHCHLQDERLAPDRAGMFQRARRVGVTAMVCCGAEEADWDLVRGLAASEPDVLPAYGLHPWFVDRRSSGWFDTLTGLLRDARAGVGEIGLDHALKQRNDADQRDVFMRQLALSHELARPVSIHCRRAWGAMLEAIRSLGRHPAGMVFHAFTGAAELVVELVDLGGYFSFSGTITASQARRAPAALKVVPADRLLVETDAPDMLPHGLARENTTTPPPNEPANLLLVIRAAAAVRGITENELAVLTCANARRLFIRE